MWAGTAEGRAIGGSSPDLNKIIFKTCKRKGIFLTLVPSRHPQGKRRAKRQVESWKRGRRRGRGFHGRESSEDTLFCP